MKEPVSLLAAASSEGRLTPPRDRHFDPTLNGALAEEHSRSTILARHPGTVKSRRWHVLPDVCAGDPERLARFEPEAKLLASLDHPSITSIHGLEEANEKRCLVLELVEGQTLANRLRKGALSVEEAGADRAETAPARPSLSWRRSRTVARKLIWPGRCPARGGLPERTHSYGEHRTEP